MTHYHMRYTSNITVYDIQSEKPKYAALCQSKFPIQYLGHEKRVFLGGSINGLISVYWIKRLIFKLASDSGTDMGSEEEKWGQMAIPRLMQLSPR